MAEASTLRASRAIDLREKLAFDGPKLTSALNELATLYGCEAAILSTCNRVEIYVARNGAAVAPSADLIAEFLPLIGPLDDAVIIALVLRYCARRMPPEVPFEAWREDPRWLDRLIGVSPPDAAGTVDCSR